jgi:hypothetical protein
MNTEGSLPFLKKHASGPNPWWVDSSGHPRNPVLKSFLLCLSLPSSLIPSDFVIKTSCVFFVLPYVIHATPVLLVTIWSCLNYFWRDNCIPSIHLWHYSPFWPLASLRRGRHSVLSSAGLHHPPTADHSVKNRKYTFLNPLIIPSV